MAANIREFGEFKSLNVDTKGKTIDSATDSLKNNSKVLSVRKAYESLEEKHLTLQASVQDIQLM